MVTDNHFIHKIVNQLLKENKTFIVEPHIIKLLSAITPYMCWKLLNNSMVSFLYGIRKC